MRDTPQVTTDSSPHGSQRMDRHEILAAYEWKLGVCFRHPADGETDTAAIGAIHGSVEDVEVRACRDCVVTLEARRELTARRSGKAYSPGIWRPEQGT